MHRLQKLIFTCSSLLAMACALIWLKRKNQAYAVYCRPILQSWLSLGQKVSELCAQLRQISAAQLATREGVTSANTTLDRMRTALEEHQNSLRVAQTLLAQFREEQARQTQALTSVEELLRSTSATEKELNVGKSHDHVVSLPRWQLHSERASQTESDTSVVDLKSSNQELDCHVTDYTETEELSPQVECGQNSCADDDSRQNGLNPEVDSQLNSCVTGDSSEVVQCKLNPEVECCEDSSATTGELLNPEDDFQRNCCVSDDSQDQLNPEVDCRENSCVTDDQLNPEVDSQPDCHDNSLTSSTELNLSENKSQNKSGKSANGGKKRGGKRKDKRHFNQQQSV